MTRSAILALLFLFDSSLSADVTGYACTASIRFMVPLPDDACTDPPCAQMSDPQPAACIVGPSSWPDAEWEAYGPDLRPGEAVWGCVWAMRGTVESSCESWTDGQGQPRHP